MHHVSPMAFPTQGVARHERRAAAGRFSRLRRGAFTLMEMMIVVVVMALLAAGAVVSLKGPYQAARFETGLERLAAFDQQVRSHARRFRRPAELIVNLAEGTLAATEPGSGTFVQGPISLPQGVTLDQVVVGPRRVDYGQTALPVSPSGRTTSYALRVRGPKQQQVWLVVAGITGQATRIDEEQHAEALFQLLATTGTDAP